MGRSSFVESLEPRQLLTAALDTKFGDGGVENLGLTLGEGQKVRAHAMLPDGKIIIAGLVRNPTDSIGFFPYVMRLLPNGTPDASFGAPVAGQPDGLPKGIVVFTDKKVLDDISELAVVGGGGILLAGGRMDHLHHDAAIVKLTLDGKLDTSFGGPTHGYAHSPAGTLVYHFDSGSIAGFFDISVSSTGRIAVTDVFPGGKSTDQDNPFRLAPSVLMLHPDGSVDQSFGSGGVYSEPYNFDELGDSLEQTKLVQLTSLSFTTDGGLVVARYELDIQDAASISGRITTSTVQLIDLTANGKSGPAPDATVFHSKKQTATFEDLGVRSDGSYLVVLHQEHEGVVVFHVLKNLTVDSSFNNGTGEAIVSIKGTHGLQSPMLAMLSDDRFYISSIDLYLGIQTAYISRFLANGPIDPVFGSSGLTTFPFFATELTFSSPGVILAAGDDLITATSILDAPNHRDLVLDKFQGDELIGLSSGGTLLLGGTSRDDSVSLSIRSSDQKLLATIGKVAKAFKNSLVRRIVVNSYGGNDSITVGAGVRGIYADGGSSNDTLRGGDGNDTLYGNSGRDSIDGGAGNDSLLGGGSSDVLIGGTGSDILEGGVGSDTLNGGDANDLLIGGLDAADLIDGGNGKNDHAQKDSKDTFSHVEILE